MDKTNNHGKALLGHVAALSAYLIFGFNIIMTKELTNAHIFSPLALYTLRAIGAGALFWLLSLFTKREKVARRDFLQIFLASLLGYFGTQITFLIGINYTTPLDCGIISTFQPVLTMLVAAVALREPITLKKAGGVAISLAGIIILIMSSAASLDDPTRLTTPFGLAMLIANSLCFATYLGIFKPLIQRYSVVTFMKWIFAFSFVMSVPFSIGDILSVNYSTVPLACLGELGYLIFMATFVAYFLIPVGQKHLRPTLVSLYSYVQPVIASALGIYLGMDRLSMTKLIAIVAVVIGVVLVNRSKKARTMAVALLFVPMLAEAQETECTQADSALVVRLLKEAKTHRGDEHPMLWFGRQFIGVPYVAHTLEGGESEHLVVNLHELDCTTFVETVVALALCDAADTRTFADYCRQLTRVRYRQGLLTDYTSRLHYFTWWAEDNERMGIVREVVPQGEDDKGLTDIQTVSLGYMTAHPGSYRQLALHPEFVPVIRKLEKASEGTRLRYIPKRNVGLAQSSPLGIIHSGDILAMTTGKPGLDTSHLGIAVWQNGSLHLLNASSLHKKVVLEAKTLHAYQQSQRSQTGIRVLRPTLAGTTTSPTSGTR